MAWFTPTLRSLREQVRDYISARVDGADASIPKTPLRVMADTQALMASLTLDFLAWLGRQMLPDTAETEWLDRHGVIWGKPRIAATFAGGSVTFTGTEGVIVPEGTQVSASGITYETTEAITLGSGPTEAGIVALNAGTAGNLPAGTSLSLLAAIAGVDSRATVVTLSGGVDSESDDSLRERVLDRIRKPPMGGDADDYVAWAREVPGVSRAWCSPNEMGPGTVTVRFMMDELRSDNDGFPEAGDLTTVKSYINARRPVAVLDFFVPAPIPQEIDFTIENLVPDTSAVRAAIEASVAAMIHDRASPAFARNGVGQDAQTIYAVWINEAVLNAPGVEHFTGTDTDHVMASKGHIAVPGTITFA